MPSVDRSERWPHDRFDDNDSARSSRQRSRRASSRKFSRHSNILDRLGDRYSKGSRKSSSGSQHFSSSRVKLTVENLKFTVTERDVKELFGTCGRLDRVVLFKDSNGKSRGVAEVTFIKNDDAIKAYRKFNGRTLDERPLRIYLGSRSTSAPKVVTASFVTKNGFKVERKIDNPLNRVTRHRPKRTQKTKAELDDELESSKNDN